MRAIPPLSPTLRAAALKAKPAGEIRRCTKRYIARRLYRSLTSAMTPLLNVLTDEFAIVGRS